MQHTHQDGLLDFRTFARHTLCEAPVQKQVYHCSRLQRQAAKHALNNRCLFAAKRAFEAPVPETILVDTISGNLEFQDRLQDIWHILKLQVQECRNEVGTGDLSVLTVLSPVELQVLACQAYGLSVPMASFESLAREHGGHTVTVRISRTCA